MLSYPDRRARRRRRFHAAVSVLVVALAVVPVAMPGAGPGEDPTPSQKALEQMFLAPCCWRESLAVHQSPEAGKARAEIAALLSEGKDTPAIVDAMVARYGERILREPRGGRSLWLTAVPVLALLLATLALAWYVRRLRGRYRAYRTVSAATGSLPGLDLDDD